MYVVRRLGSVMDPLRKPRRRQERRVAVRGQPVYVARSTGRRPKSRAASAPRPAVLPHSAMISSARSCPQVSSNGITPGPLGTALRPRRALGI